MIRRTIHTLLLVVTDLQWDGQSLCANGCWKREYIGIGSSRRAAERDALAQYGTRWRADAWASNGGSWRMGSAMIGAYTEEGTAIDLQIEGLRMAGSGLAPVSTWSHVATVRLGARSLDISVQGHKSRRSALRAIVREAAETFATEDYKCQS